MKSLFFKFVYNVAMVVIAEKRGPVMDDMFGPSKILDVCDYFPLLKWIDLLGIHRNMEVLNRKRDRFLQDLIDDVRSKIEDSVSVKGKKSYLEALLSMQQAKPEYYTDEIVKGLILVSLRCKMVFHPVFCRERLIYFLLEFSNPTPFSGTWIK